VLPHKDRHTPRKRGIQYAAPFDSITDASEYCVARRSLSSGGHSADPLAGDDGWGYGAFVHCEVDGGQFAK
jgi:hypothetical protein